MKKLIITLAALLSLGFTSISTTAADEPVAGMVQITLSVQGMTCITCVPRLRIGLNRTGAVHEVDASVDEDTATITYDPETIDVDGLIKAIESVGFRASRLDI